MASWHEAVAAQLRSTVGIVKSLLEIVVDGRMSSRISLHSFASQFFLLVLREGVTNPQVTCEQLAAEFLGEDSSTALNGKVGIITGASGGLGWEQTRVLLKYGCHVVLAVRSPEKAERLLEQLRAEKAPSGRATVLQLDLDDLATVKPFVDKFLALGLPLHYLVNNAGVMTPKEFRASKQGYETQFATNHLAHFLLTDLLLPKLRETRELTGADVRIVVLSSVASCLLRECDLTELLPPPKEAYHGMPEYGISKALNLMHVRELQKRCAADGITCCAVHPGVIKTGLIREGNQDSMNLYESVLFTWMHKDVGQGAATQMYCTLCPDVPEQVSNGTYFWYNSGPQCAWGINAPGVRPDLPGKVWALSEKLVADFR